MSFVLVSPGQPLPSAFLRSWIPYPVQFIGGKKKIARTEPQRQFHTSVPAGDLSFFFIYN